MLKFEKTSDTSLKMKMMQSLLRPMGHSALEFQSDDYTTSSLPLHLKAESEYYRVLVGNYEHQRTKIRQNSMI